jgi:Tfp pilus assembly protein PilP
MMMTLEKASKNLIAAAALLLCLVPVLEAQSQPAAKPAARAKSAPMKKPAAPTPVASGAAPKVQVVPNKRDPFAPLVNTEKEAGGGPHLPPGKAGLVVATVRVDGTVSGPNGMIAMVTSPEEHVYFIREGDQLYDGSVEKIGLDGVTFREISKDPFGKVVERIVTKRIYASAGEQQ